MRMPWTLRMTLRIAFFALPLFIYVGWRLSTAISTRFKVSKKIVLAIVFAVILWIYLYPITIKAFHLTGNINRFFVLKPQLHWQDYLILFPFWWGFIAVAEMAPFYVTLDAISLLTRLNIFSSSAKEKWRKVQEFLKIGLTAFFLLYVGIRSYVDTNHVRVSNYQVAVKNLPENFHGLKICLSGDIHVDRYTRDKKLKKLKDIVHSGEEDLLLYTGDLVTGGRSYITPALNILCNPQPKIASIACMGDHDFWTAAQDIPRRMKNCGWTFLQNEHRLINYKGYKILVTGITYVYSWKISNSELNKLLSRAPAADLKILLVHQPMELLVETAARYGYHLLLGGHTHGGQIVPHIFGMPVTPSIGETPYFRGLSIFKNLRVIVTNGIGLTLAPLRYHAPAEITRITLK